MTTSDPRDSQVEWEKELSLLKTAQVANREYTSADSSRFSMLLFYLGIVVGFIGVVLAVLGFRSESTQLASVAELRKEVENLQEDNLRLVQGNSDLLSETSTLRAEHDADKKRVQVLEEALTTLRAELKSLQTSDVRAARWDEYGDKDLKRMCDIKGIGSACTAYGSRLGKAEDKPTAKKYFKLGCNNGHGPGCTNQAYLLKQESSVDSKRKAMDLYKFACDELDNAASCGHYAYHLRLGMSNVLNKNKEQAFEYGRRSCLLGSSEGCLQLYTHFSEQVEDDPKRLELRRKACAFGVPDACSVD